MLPAPQLPVMLSIFAQSPDQAYLSALEAEYDQLLEIFNARTDLRYISLPSGKTGQLLKILPQHAKDLQILHFGGHADGQHLFLADQAGTGAGLAQLLKVCPKLQLVVLNGCQTLDQAQDYLAMGVPAVIATTCSVADGQARQFAESLYRALANHQSLESAFEQAAGATRFRQDTNRGLELAAHKDAQPWLLEVQVEGAEKIKAWVLAGQKRSVILPEGVRDLEQFFIKGNKATKYKHYLSAGVLPYYSLDAFYAERGEEDELFSERKMIQALLEDTEVEGGIISGQGGVGKTRLMLELGLMAEQQGWKVLVLNEKFKNDATFGALLEQQAGQPFLFLIDYVEECGWFHENWLDELRSYCTEELELKFLANCRNSFSYPKQDAWLEIAMEEHEAQKDYERWVIQKILAGVIPELQHEDPVQEISIKKPSFAVFLRFWHERDSGKSNKLGNIKDFQTWLLKRFIQTVDPARQGIAAFGKEIAWLLSFPLEEGHKQAYLQADSVFQTALNNLIRDGWVEKSESGYTAIWRVVQDTVSDELVLAYLRTCSDVEVALVDSFRYAYQVQRGRHWLQQMQRLKNEPIFTAQDGLFYRILEQVLEHKAPEEVELDYQIWRSGLLSLDEKLKLAEIVPGFFLDSLWFYDFIHILNALLKATSQGQGNEAGAVQRLVDKWIKSYWQNLTHTPYWGLSESLLITNYVRVFGLDEVVGPLLRDFLEAPVYEEASYVLQVFWEEQIKWTFKARKYLLNYLKTYVESYYAGFVLKAWLDASDDFDSVRPFVLQYLRNNAHSKEATFVLKAWLNASKDFETVRPFVLQYLHNNAQQKNVDFVLKAWLDASKDFDAVRPFVLQYLQNNAQQNEAQFVLKAWLDASKEFDTIQPFVLQYLQTNAQQNNADFVLKSWLDASKDFHTIRPFVLQYLQNNTQQSATPFILKSWLDASKDFDTVRPFVLQYLQNSTQQNETPFILKSWLDISNEFDTVRHFVFQYLQSNAQLNEARFVLKAWLDTSKEFDIARPFVLQYLQNNAQQNEAQFVLKAWLDASKDFDTVQSFVIQYLQNNAQQNEAQFVLKAWLDASKDFDTVQPFVLQYLQNNAQQNKSQFVLKAWLDASKDFDAVRPFVLQYLQNNAQQKEATFVLQAWLNAQGSVSSIKGFLIEYLQKNATHAQARFVLIAWLRRGQAIATIQPYLQIFLNEHSTHHERVEFYQLAMQNKEYQEEVKTYIPRWIRANLDHEEVIKVWVSWVLTYGELEQARALGSQIHRYYMEGHKADAFWEQLPEEGSPGRGVIDEVLPEKV